MVITGFWRFPDVVVLAVRGALLAIGRLTGGSWLGLDLAKLAYSAPDSLLALGRLAVTLWWLFVAQVYLWLHAAPSDYRFWLFVVAGSISAGLYLWLVGMRVYEARSWH